MAILFRTLVGFLSVALLDLAGGHAANAGEKFWCSSQGVCARHDIVSSNPDGSGVARIFVQQNWTPETGLPATLGPGQKFIVRYPNGHQFDLWSSQAGLVTFDYAYPPGNARPYVSMKHCSRSIKIAGFTCDKEWSVFYIAAPPPGPPPPPPVAEPAPPPPCPEGQMRFKGVCQVPPVLPGTTSGKNGGFIQMFPTLVISQDLNIHKGPGPEFEIVGIVRATSTGVLVDKNIDGWCKFDKLPPDADSGFAGGVGWVWLGDKCKP